MFKISGSIKVINDAIQVSEKFMKREFVLTDNSSMYPQDIIFQCVQDKCAMMDAFNVGDHVEVSFNLRGREWISPQNEVRYFNSLDAWRIEKIAGDQQNSGGSGSAAHPSGMNGEMAQAEFDQGISEEEDDDLPF